MAGRNPILGGPKSKSGRALIEFEALNPVAGTPEPPAHLDKDGVYAWVLACRSMIPSRTLSYFDLAALEGFAEAFSRWRKCERACKKRGGEYSGPAGGYPQVSAARGNANTAFKQFMDAGRSLGMTPVARIKTTQSAQGDLPLGDPMPTSAAGGDMDVEDDTVIAMTSVFQARPVVKR